VGIRETLNKNPMITTGVLAGVILIAIVWSIWYLVGNPFGGGDGERTPDTKAFYTIDDGATTFVDEVDKIVPFKKDGKDAVKAHVYECKGTRTIAYLEKFDDAAKAKLEKFYSNPANKGKYMPERYEVEQTGKFYKKPGAANKWVKANSDESANVAVVPKCGDDWASPARADGK
jgi:hypothetical protein